MGQKITVENHKQMRGVEFKCINRSKELTTCFVADVDKDVGITIKDINSDDPDSYEYCYNAKIAERMGIRKSTITRAILDRLNRLSKLINSGEVFYILDILPESRRNQSGQTTCAFS